MADLPNQKLPTLGQSVPVQGTIATGVADDGSAPVKVGGVYRVSPPTLADGERADLQVNNIGDLEVVVANVGVASAGDGIASLGALETISFTERFNGSTWDRDRTPINFIPISGIAVVAGTGAIVWTPGAGKKFRLMGFQVGLSVAGAVLFKDESVEKIRTGQLLAGDSTFSPPLGNGILSAAANNRLIVDVTTSGNIDGFIFGMEE